MTFGEYAAAYLMAFSDIPWPAGITGLAARRSRETSIAGSGLLRAAVILTGLMIAANVVAIWAMTTKPT